MRTGARLARPQAPATGVQKPASATPHLAAGRRTAAWARRGVGKGSPATTFVLVALVSALGACALLGRRAGPPGPLVEVPAREVPSFDDDLDRASLELALARTIANLDTRPEGTYLGSGPYRLSARVLAEGLRRFRTLLATVPATELRAALLREFTIVRAAGGSDGHVLLTGYYEPELRAALARSPEYPYPIYARPPDLVEVDLQTFGSGCRALFTAGRVEGGRLVPYPSRAEIDAGALAGRGLEIAWVSDPVELFLLHVQGSGRLRLPDGRALYVGYAGSNGRPFRSPVRALVERGLLPPEQASADGLRAYLKAHPESVAATLAIDERYTFFSLADRPAAGSFGVELVPGRSLAADPRVIPPGALVYLRSLDWEAPERESPAPGVPGPVARFALVHDTGAAIIGPGRADLFLGPGREAAEQAAHLSKGADLYLLLPRPAAAVAASERNGASSSSSTGSPWPSEEPR